ncbi:DUF2797 domain-containing protein [Naumannella halotolerans]|uniref:Uncharacterized protein DUF2797 n=1 Tax=Naumannella halotolerans TaxID=993414 RepID=A0A4V3EN76_9ACTN|nr:DUF2797 domain-containing protein [Naumannella halotolerans]TDT32718.1 uncharacterized protein DUF2797 [Naumannella halotolerans]
MKPAQLPAPGEWLVHGVRLDATRRPVLLAESRGHFVEWPLTGRQLGFRVSSPERWCLGHRDTDGNRIACPDTATVITGQRCARCEAADPYRWMHIVHRSAFLGPHLRAQVMQPHWLYVASFGPRLHKVGTAVQGRQWTRVAEQGALLAGYLAVADDGIEVRRLEDLVSARTALGQVVRPAAKSAALVAGATPESTRAGHDRLITEARALLRAETTAAVIDEQWIADPDPAPMLAGHILHAYPYSLAEGAHGFEIICVLGSSALVRLQGDEDDTFVVDLTHLTGRRIVTASIATTAPAVQNGLF